MIIYVLMGQRKENYPGEYAPEALACMDDEGQSINPDYLAGKKAEADETNDFENTVIVALEANTRSILSLLRPAAAVIPAAVLPA